VVATREGVGGSSLTGGGTLGVTGGAEEEDGGVRAGGTNVGAVNTGGGVAGIS
jgi:hypothetical protein